MKKIPLFFEQMNEALVGIKHFKNMMVKKFTLEFSLNQLGSCCVAYDYVWGVHLKYKALICNL